MNKLLSISLLSADFGQLHRDVEMVNNSAADWIHLDIMDGVFVPNISFGMPVVKSVNAVAKKPLDTHLMIVDPDRYLETFASLGAAWLTVHYEACTHLHRTLQKIRSLGMKSGIALNPHTPVSLVRDVLPETDMVLIMSVNPGFGGQQFIERSYRRIGELKELIVRENTATLIEVDGGVNAQNATALFAAGADVLVTGNAVFSAAQPLEAITQMKK